MTEERRKVYAIVENKTDEIIYIGKTRSSLEQRWFYHTWKDNWSTTPVRKYMEDKGFQQFRIALVRLCDTEQDLDDWEKHFILDCAPCCNVRLWT